MTNEEMAATIKLVREKNYLTQKEFAQVLGVATQTVWYWEKGLKRPKLKHLKIIEQMRVSKLNENIAIENKELELSSLKIKARKQDTKAL